jgi:dTMP kinase
MIRPYLFDHSGIVICDRYADSFYAYQGYGLGRDLDELRAITAVATGGLQPDATMYLDLSAEEGLERKRSKRRIARPMPLDSNNSIAQQLEWNRMDARELAFHKRVEMGYRELIAESPERWHILDARQSIDWLAQQIFTEIEPLLERVRLLEPDAL